MPITSNARGSLRVIANPRVGAWARISGVERVVSMYFLSSDPAIGCTSGS